MLWDRSTISLVAVVTYTPGAELPPEFHVASVETVKTLNKGMNELNRYDPSRVPVMLNLKLKKFLKLGQRFRNRMRTFKLRSLRSMQCPYQAYREVRCRKLNGRIRRFRRDATGAWKNSDAGGAHGAPR